MRMVIAGTCLVVALAAVAHSSAAGQDKDETPKYTIKEVMKKGQNKGGLYMKVLSGKASDADAKTLLEMYQSLAKQKPPAGDADSWKTKTTALIEGAQLYVDGKKDDGLAKMRDAGNCMNCHKVHKG
jgi:cytochrome c553